MAPIKYIPQSPPLANYRTWLWAELRRIGAVSVTVADLLEALGDKPINVGAPNSGGVGQRALTIDN